MAAANLKSTKISVLLSINAAAILIAGILIAGAIGLTGGIEFTVVSERNDEIDGEISEADLIDAEGNAKNSLTEDQRNYISLLAAQRGISDLPVKSNELWSEDSIVMYQTANFDICVGGGLSDIGKMYWQTSNADVISGFYSSSRTWLGFTSDICRYPEIVGTGVTVITAGTYDGTRSDSITVTVIEPPAEAFKYEVLSLVNQERVKNGLEKLSWGDSCAEAAQIRAEELTASYSHTRPDGREWSTACIEPTDGEYYFEGENLMAGNASPTPETAVAAWMNSEAHRANILNPNFTKLSVGFYYDKNTQYKVYWSQYFSNF